MSCNLKKLFLRLVREFLAQLLEHLLDDVANAIRHPVKYFLEHREVLVCNVSKILEVVDERGSSLLVLERHVTGYVGIPATSLTGAKLLVVDCRLVDLHRVAFEIQLLIVDNVLADDCAQELFQELAVSRRANKAAKEFCPEEVATGELLQGRTTINLFPERPCHKLEKPVLFSSLLSQSEQAHCQLLDALSILLFQALLSDAPEQTRQVLRLRLQSEE